MGFLRGLLQHCINCQLYEAQVRIPEKSAQLLTQHRPTQYRRYIYLKLFNIFKCYLELTSTLFKIFRLIKQKGSRICFKSFTISWTTFWSNLSLLSIRSFKGNHCLKSSFKVLDITQRGNIPEWLHLSLFLSVLI